MSVRKRRLRGGWRWGFDKTVRGTRLWSPYIYLTREQAEAAEAQAVHHYITTGQVLNPTAITGGPSSPETVGEVFRRWLEWLKLHRSPRHYRDMMSLIPRALEQAPDLARLPADRLTVEQVERWAKDWAADLARRGKGPGEVNKFLVAGQTAFNEPWGRTRAQPVRELNPFRWVDRLSVERRAKYVPTPQEVRALRMAADPEFRLYLDILYETAARPAEARVIAWEDVQDESLILYTRKTRHGHRIPRRLGISQELADRLASWRRQQGPGYLFVFAMRAHKDRPREATWVRKQMRATCARAGVEYFPVGCMRHFTASRWAAEGVPFTTIQVRLGHSQATTTNNYLRELQGV